MKRQIKGIKTANAIDTNTGRMTVISVKVDPALRVGIIWTIIRPTMSSIMAALVRTTPRRLSVRPLVARTVKVVPSDVEHSAAPAANACTGESGNMPRRTKEIPMGAAIPVRATAEDKKRFALRDFRLLEMPPANVSVEDLGSSVSAVVYHLHTRLVSIRCTPAEQSSAGGLPTANSCQACPMLSR
jgi:hypothetical protein